MLNTIKTFLTDTGIFQLLSKSEDSFVLDNMWWQTAVMFLIAFVLVYLAIVKGFEPLLLLPIAIGMLLTNIPGGGMFNLDFFIPSQESVLALEEAFADGWLTLTEYDSLKAIGLPVAEYFENFTPVGAEFTQTAYD